MNGTFGKYSCATSTNASPNGGGIIALAFVLIIFTIFVRKILRRLKQLKSEKL
jgi:hypothetical protein